MRDTDVETGNAFVIHPRKQNQFTINNHVAVCMYIYVAGRHSDWRGRPILKGGKNDRVELRPSRVYHNIIIIILIKT